MCSYLYQSMGSPDLKAMYYMQENPYFSGSVDPLDSEASHVVKGQC